MIKGISGSTIGIFGLGRIGMAVAKRLQSFNPKQIIYHNRNSNDEAEKSNLKYVDFETLLKESDFLICTCASTNETANKFNLKLFEKMKKNSIFINVSRGNVVNQNDLCIALKTGLIAAAGNYLNIKYLKVQNGPMKGKCGICGDPFNANPRQHEAPGGIYANGIIVKTYLAGKEN